jgi:Flp pilus assembly protein TadD
LSASGYHNLGIACHQTHRLDEAEEAFRKALELSPERVVTHSLLALLLLDEGRKEEALEEAVLEPDECRRLGALAVVHHAAGRSEDSERALRAMTEKYAGAMAYDIAGTHALRGETDRAFEWLERAYEKRSTVLWEVKTDCYFRSLHGDPRWEAFLGKMGLRSA